MNARREIDDMQGKIDDLESVVDSLSGIIAPDFISVMQSVIDEWRSYTCPCMEEMLEEKERD